MNLGVDQVDPVIVDLIRDLKFWGEFFFAKGLSLFSFLKKTKGFVL